MIIVQAWGKHLIVKYLELGEGQNSQSTKKAGAKPVPNV